MKPEPLIAFIRESNGIESITREPTVAEIQAHEDILSRDTINVDSLCEFVRIVADAEIRSRVGMNVRIGNFIPPPGGPLIRRGLENLLGSIEKDMIAPWSAHCVYERLHPFTDGNGRSGRVLWAWHMNRAGQDPFTLSFLHRFYYQTLAGATT